MHYGSDNKSPVLEDNQALRKISFIYIYKRVSSYTTNVINEILLDTKTYVFWRICDITTWTMANNRGHGVYTVAQWKLTHKPKLRGMRIMNPLLALSSNTE